jgi:hypothetical protein
MMASRKVVCSEDTMAKCQGKVNEGERVISLSSQPPLEGLHRPGGLP